MTKPTPPSTPALSVYYHSTNIVPAPGRSFHDDVLNFSLRRSLSDVAALYNQGFFPDGTTVWINGDMPELGMWILTDTSTHLRSHTAARPGWCRVTRTSVRFAQRAVDTARNPAKTFTLNDAEGLDLPHSTIIVNYAAKTTPVQFQCDGTTVKPDNGKFTFDPFTIIDMPRHTPTDQLTDNPLDIAHAHQNGFALMTYGCSEERRRFVHDNYNVFKYDFTRRALDGMFDVDEKLNRAAGVVIYSISDGMHSAVAQE